MCAILNIRDTVELALSETGKQTVQINRHGDVVGRQDQCSRISKGMARQLRQLELEILSTGQGAYSRRVRYLVGKKGACELLFVEPHEARHR